MSAPALNGPSSVAPIKLFTVDELFAGWQRVQKRLCNDDGVFNQSYQVTR
jgi:ABC-type sulfate transport system substrate-binding protein